MEKLTVIKIGGNVIDDLQTLNRFLDDFAGRSGAKLLVHGGGKIAGEVAAALGVESRMVEGRRITSAAMLRVVTMVYGGLVNKQLVSGLQARGCNALGLSGADGNLIAARKRPAREIDYGFAGDVEQVNAPALHGLLKSGYVPVLAPLTHDRRGGLLNTNADTIAAAVAVAMSALYRTTLLFGFEKPGVLRSGKTGMEVVSVLDVALYQELKKTGEISGGMVPKLDNAFCALQDGVGEVRIGDAGSLLGTTSDDPAGGTVLKLNT